MNKLDKYHYHEFIDRCSVIQDNIENNLRKHPVVNKEISDKIDAIQYILSELYNDISIKADNLKMKEVKE
jgi:hypothetical protein